MVLEFTKKDGKWVANAVVNGDYALHIERAEPGVFNIKQLSASEGNYAPCKIPPDMQYGRWMILDEVFAHGYYPMKLEFVSFSEVTKAELNEVTV